MNSYEVNINIMQDSYSLGGWRTTFTNQPTVPAIDNM